MHAQRPQVKIRGDNQRGRWYPAYCFDLSGADAITIKQIIITDPIEPPITHSIDVEIEFSDGQWRCCSFLTPELIATLHNWLEGTRTVLWYNMKGLVILGEITEELIYQSLREIESQGDIIESTHLMEP